MDSSTKNESIERPWPLKKLRDCAYFQQAETPSDDKVPVLFPQSDGRLRRGGVFGKKEMTADFTVKDGQVLAWMEGIHVESHGVMTRTGSLLELPGEPLVGLWQARRPSLRRGYDWDNECVQIWHTSMMDCDKKDLERTIVDPSVGRAERMRHQRIVGDAADMDSLGLVALPGFASYQELGQNGRSISEEYLKKLDYGRHPLEAFQTEEATGCTMVLGACGDWSTAYDELHTFYDEDGFLVGAEVHFETNANAPKDESSANSEAFQKLTPRALAAQGHATTSERLARVNLKLETLSSRKKRKANSSVKIFSDGSVDSPLPSPLRQCRTSDNTKTPRALVVPGHASMPEHSVDDKLKLASSSSRKKRKTNSPLRPCPASSTIQTHGKSPSRTALKPRGLFVDNRGHSSPAQSLGDGDHDEELRIDTNLSSLPFIPEEELAYEDDEEYEHDEPSEFSDEDDFSLFDDEVVVPDRLQRLAWFRVSELLRGLFWKGDLVKQPNAPSRGLTTLDDRHLVLSDATDFHHVLFGSQGDDEEGSEVRWEELYVQCILVLMIWCTMVASLGLSGVLGMCSRSL